VECDEAVLVAALDASAHLLATDVAIQLPAASRDLFDLVHWFHQCRVPDGYLGNPDCADDVGPFRRVGLFESAFGVRTEDTGGLAAADKLTFATEPLAFGDERNTIAVLVHGEIATIAENNGICVFTLAIVANRALAVLLLARFRMLSIDRCS
jgi:hypothetical protein